RDVEEDLRPRGARVQLELDRRSEQVHMARRDVDRRGLGDAAAHGRPPARDPGGPAAPAVEWGTPRVGALTRAVLARQVEERLVSTAEPPVLVLGAGELDRSRQKHRLERREAG